MPKQSMDLMQGTLDMLILSSLLTSPKHGYAVMRWIRTMSEEELHIEEGALYPALHRMQERGWVTSDWGLSENNRQAKFYKLTPKGRNQLQVVTSSWARYVKIMAKVLQAETAA